MLWRAEGQMRALRNRRSFLKTKQWMVRTRKRPFHRIFNLNCFFHIGAHGPEHAWLQRPGVLSNNEAHLMICAI